MQLHIYLLFIASKFNWEQNFIIWFSISPDTPHPLPCPSTSALSVVGLQLLQEQQQQHEKYIAQFMMALSSFGIVIKVINMDAPSSVCLCFVVPFPPLSLCLYLSLCVLACVFHLFALLAYLFIRFCFSLCGISLLFALPSALLSFSFSVSFTFVDELYLSFQFIRTRSTNSCKHTHTYTPSHSRRWVLVNMAHTF